MRVPQRVPYGGPVEPRPQHLPVSVRSYSAQRSGAMASSPHGVPRRPVAVVVSPPSRTTRARAPGRFPVEILRREPASAEDAADPYVVLAEEGEAALRKRRFSTNQSRVGGVTDAAGHDDVLGDPARQVAVDETAHARVLLRT